MKRRDFIKKTLGAGMAAGSAFTIGGVGQLFASNTSESNLAYDLVAIKGGEPDTMFNKGMNVLGGISNYVKKGQKVVIKPNIGWDAIPERAANTNPKLISHIVKSCIQAGAKDVYVFDNTCDTWTRCYKNSGIETAVKNAGGKIVPGNSEKYYQEVAVPKGKRLRSTKIHELILESDVFINVPVLKHHSSTNLSIAMKNLMGIVWDRRYWHRNALHQCIADFSTYRKPDLNIIDAYRVMMKNGPRGVSNADVKVYKYMVISPDIVAADSAAAKIFGSQPENISHIKIANDMNVGEMDLENLNISRIKLS
ncbi:DUF362 domain-containing protein [candidate division KSB1 bacterium]